MKSNLDKAIRRTLAIAALFTSLGASASCPSVDLPSDIIKVDEGWGSAVGLVTSFNIISQQGEKLGKISREIINLTTRFNLKNLEGDLVAYGENKLLSFGTVTNFYDCNGDRIGKLGEEIFKSMFQVYTSYKLYDEHDYHIATSKKVEFILSTFSLYNSDTDEEVVEINQRWHPLKDNWSVHIKDDYAIDSRIALLIPAFKSQANHNRKNETESKEADSKKK